MRIVVLGASGMMGTLVADRFANQGHDVVRAMRSNGVDTASGSGLAGALSGADAVVDCTNYATANARKAVRVLGGMSANVVDAARRAGVKHLVLLSILNAADPALRGMGYYQGKAAQEKIIGASGLPHTIVRSSQWFEFTRTMLTQVRLGGLAFAPRMKSAPVAAAAVAELITQVAADPALGSKDVAGPEDFDLLDLARIVAKRDGLRVRLVPVPLPGATRALAGGALLPRPDVERRGPTFEQWLAAR
jgi:uncharacterized protein YbjT (DUF2867 family)